MPATVNGIGTSVCDARGHVSWGGIADSDAVECFVFLYLPLIPIKAVHTFQWNGINYRQHPIQWSFGLLLRAFARRWLIVPAIAAVFSVFIGFGLNDPWVKAEMFLLATALVVIVVLGYWLLWVTDQRNRNLRRVLGPHDLGSSDPAIWLQNLLDLMPPPRKLFNAETYGAAVPILLEDRRYGSAMMAARLTVAVEDAKFGEELTDMILNDGEVLEALAIIRKHPQQWAVFMEAGGSQQPPAAQPPGGEVPHDDQITRQHDKAP